MNQFLILHLITGTLFLAVSLMMKIWPPKKINSFYGYRTPRSMKNQLAWDDANTFSADLMMWSGISLLFVQVICYVLIGGHISLLVSIGYFLAAILTTVVLTERRLIKKNF